MKTKIIKVEMAIGYSNIVNSQKVPTGAARVSTYDKSGVVDQKRFTNEADALVYATEQATAHNLEITTVNMA